MIRFRFEPQVAVEAVLYIAHRSQDPTSHHISKILYFADRLHLSRFGRFICGDTYIAMQNGPVPSGIYDMLKDARGDTSAYRYIESIGAFDVVNGYRIVPRRAPNRNWLSDSSIACIDEALEHYDDKSFGELTRLSHDAAWNDADPNGTISVESILDSMEDTEDLLAHLLEPMP